MAEPDPRAMTIDEQVAVLMEGTYFADEGGLEEAADAPAGGLRKQMAAELKAKLKWSMKTSTPLRVYLGVDPTRDSLHIGHMMPVLLLRRFQELGHQVVFLIGDYTATVGDPSGQSKQREQLTHEQALKHAAFYTGQAFRLLSEAKTEIRHNSEWLADLRFADIAELASLFPLAQITARQDFRDRLQSGAGVRFHECLYSLMQGFDAFALNCDVQVGAYDQHFNLLAGRIIQDHFAGKLKGRDHPLRPGEKVKGPHVMVTIPLLMGTDGRKMSKSWDNTIDVLAAPEDMYGKVMRISDETLPHYLDVAVVAQRDDKERQRARIAGDPMDVKKWVAHKITALYHGEAAAGQAAEHFKRTVQEKDFSEQDIEELTVPQEYRGVDKRVAYLIQALKLAGSRKEAERLMEGGGVKLDGEPVTDKFALYEHKPGVILKFGKRKVYRLL